MDCNLTTSLSGGWSIHRLPPVCLVRIHALPSAVIGLGSVVCSLWLCLPPSHLWLPVARGVTSFHNSHLQKDTGLYTSVTLHCRHTALKLHWSVCVQFFKLLDVVTQNWIYILLGFYLCWFICRPKFACREHFLFCTFKTFKQMQVYFPSFKILGQWFLFVASDVVISIYVIHIVIPLEIRLASTFESNIIE